MSPKFRRIARAFFVCSALFLLFLWLIDRSLPSLVAEWSLATLFVFITAVLWLYRFRAERWRKIQVLAGAEPAA